MAVSEGDANTEFFEDFIHKSLKDEQTECIRRIVCLEDVLALLPTGFGKSVIYQLIPKVRMKKLHPSSGFKTSVVVVSPWSTYENNKSKMLKRRIVESLLSQLGNPSRLTEKLRQGTSTLFTEMLNNDRWSVTRGVAIFTRRRFW